jgi:hypothetical protein
VRGPGRSYERDSAAERPAGDADTIRLDPWERAQLARGIAHHLDPDRKRITHHGSGDEEARVVAGSEAPLLTALEKRFRESSHQRSLSSTRIARDGQ